MSYQVIARKYRPQRFEDVVGQEHVTQTLSNAIRSGRIAHAYLFCGPRGTGKTTVARIFAKALNCTGGPKADFDDSDPRCREIAEGRSLDVLEIDGASNNGVDQVRELRETARFAPASSKYKIYIIDEVHMLSAAAFNALLKTLEEPPAHVKFLFATTDPEKVLPTILSRCQRFDLRRIPSALIVQHLGTIARAEGVAIDEPALHAVARGADGGMRDAESTLDQLISFCGERIEEADVLSMFGLTARAQLIALARALLESNATAALRELNELARNGKDLGRMLTDLLHHLRNLLVYQVAGADLALLEVSDLEAAELRVQADLAPAESVSRMLEVLTAAEGRLRDAVARKIFLEVTLLKAIQARNAVSLDSVIRQLQQLRDQGGVTAAAVAPTASAAVPSSGGTPAPALSAATPPVAPVSGDVGSVWEQVVNIASPFTRSALLAGVPMSLEKGILTVGFPTGSESQMAIVDTERVRKGIEGKLAEWGRPAVLKFVKTGTTAPITAASPAGVPASAPVTPPPPPTRASTVPSSSGSSNSASAPVARARAEKVAPMKLDPAEFKNDPLIKEAIEVFRGQLVEVRRVEDPGSST